MIKVFAHFLCYAILACFCMPLLTSCASQKTIVNGLDEKEANEIMVFLASKNIDSTKVLSSDAGGGGGSKIVLWDIRVDGSQANEAMALLNQSGLPRRKGQSLLGIFSTGGLVPSELQEKIRYQAGLAEQIASTIRKIDGVLDAEVQISFPEVDPLHPEAESKQKITASVYVKHSGVLDDPNSHLLTKIKRLVASSITGLDYDNVTVIADRARYGGTPSEMQGGASEEPKEYVSIWSIVLAKESMTRFRMVFFSFVIVILLLLIAFIWMGWKIAPLLNRHGGIKELFHIHPIPLEPKETEGAKEAAAKAAAAAKEEGEKKEEETGKIDQDIDQV